MHPTTLIFKIIVLYFFAYWTRSICRQLNDNKLDGLIPAELGKLEQLFELCVFVTIVCSFDIYNKFLLLIGSFYNTSGILPTMS